MFINNNKNNFLKHFFIGKMTRTRNPEVAVYAPQAHPFSLKLCTLLSENHMGEIFCSSHMTETLSYWMFIMNKR